MAQKPVLKVPAFEGLARPARIAADDPRFALAERLERPESVREAVAAGRVRAINAETGGGLLHAPASDPAAEERAAAERARPPEPRPVEERVAASRRTAPEVALSTKVPDYVLRQLRRRYAESGITIRNQLLFALRLAGVEVRDADLLDERKRGRKA